MAFGTKPEWLRITMQRITYPNGKVVVTLTNHDLPWPEIKLYQRAWQFWNMMGEWEPIDTRISNIVPFPSDATVEQKEL